MKKYIFPILIVIAVINVGGVYLFKYNKKKKLESAFIYQMQSNASKLGYQNITKSKLFILRSQRVSLQSEIQNNPYTLMILMDPTGCGSCLNEKYLWNKIDSEHYVNVVVIVNNNNNAETLLYLKYAHIKPKKIIDSIYLSLQSLSPKATPVKILVNKNGQVLLADYVEETSEGRAYFDATLKDYLNDR